MNSKWFFIGFVMVALGIFGYISAEQQSTNAEIGLFSGYNTIKDFQAAGQARLIAMGFGILGGLLCLAGIAMPEESEEPKKKKRVDKGKSTDNQSQVVIIQPKKEDD